LVTAVARIRDEKLLAVQAFASAFGVHRPKPLTTAQPPTNLPAQTEEPLTREEHPARTEEHFSLGITEENPPQEERLSYGHSCTNFNSPRATHKKTVDSVFSANIGLLGRYRPIGHGQRYESPILKIGESGPSQSALLLPSATHGPPSLGAVRMQLTGTNQVRSKTIPQSLLLLWRVHDARISGRRIACTLMPNVKN
jgi:hypothetical protein